MNAIEMKDKIREACDALLALVDLVHDVEEELENHYHYDSGIRDDR